MARPDSWFRFYNATLDNAKAQRLPAELFKAWVNVLCLASRCGGKLPCNADVAFALRIDETASETLQVTLRERGLLDWGNGVYTPHDWDDLQFVSDSSTDRVKRFRDRNQKQPRNVSETTQEKNRPEQIREDTPIAPKGASLEFEKFWEAFPEKVGKKAAIKSWERAKDRPDLQTILAALAAYIAAKPADRPWCNPATWLNQGRWNDAPAATPAASSPVGETAQWAVRCEGFTKRGFWLKDQWGPPPGTPGCRVPPEIVATVDPLEIPDFMRRRA